MKDQSKKAEIHKMQKIMSETFVDVFYDEKPDDKLDMFIAQVAKNQLREITDLIDRVIILKTEIDSVKSKKDLRAHINPELYQLKNKVDTLYDVVDNKLFLFFYEKGYGVKEKMKKYFLKKEYKVEFDALLADFNIVYDLYKNSSK
jgi:hypothetical protein